MYIQVKTNRGEQAVITVSKTELVASLKEKIEKQFDVPLKKQRLFFSGKHLEDDYRLFDYKINVNSVIQLFEKTDIESLAPIKEDLIEKPNDEVPCESPYFKIGHTVDACDTTYGAWFEGTIIKIVSYPPEPEIFYQVQFIAVPLLPPVLVGMKMIRPVSRTIIPPKSVKPDDVLMVNYNPDEPNQLGRWYDFKVRRVDKVKGRLSLVGTIYLGLEKAPLDDIDIYTGEFWKIEENTFLKDRSSEEEALLKEPPPMRKGAPFCGKCKDNVRRKCKECGCGKCGGKEEPDKQIVCDECESSFHIWCLKPPLTELPDVDDWYCHDCKNDEKEIVKAGEKLKETSKKANLPSSKTTRDWGRGMACVGRTKECLLVPSNHFGPIPGIEVGAAWKYRFQVSENGVHRPHVAGIHGRDNEGAFSIVLSGGYEDDIDNGNEFLYTGSGGRDLSGNKRTADQSCDQTLTRMNKALALNCDAKLNAVNGAEANDWKKGLPVRVVRNWKLNRHSKFAPAEGNRYDGIYKVVKYFPVKGKSGFIVWRYLLRRDDPIPAPWTTKGKERMASLGIEIQYPENYLDSLNNKKGGSDPITIGKKRARSSIGYDKDMKPLSVLFEKKLKASFSIDDDLMKLIKGDLPNSKLWSSLVENVATQKSFLEKIEEGFSCACCMMVVFEPITTSCAHNICQGCLKHAYASGISTCPNCRNQLSDRFDFKINTNLGKILSKLFPGYEANH